MRFRRPMLVLHSLAAFSSRSRVRTETALVARSPRPRVANETDGVQRIAAFADGESGGNPAGVMIRSVLPHVPEMKATAAAVGYSETVFAAPLPGEDAYGIRFFAPESEVSFCGHATIALGACLTLEHGEGVYALRLHDGVYISVEGRREGNAVAAALQSPPTSSVLADDVLRARILALFCLHAEDLDERIPMSVANAGSSHTVVALKERSVLADMAYDLEEGRALMNEYGLTTICLLHAATETSMTARCPFASGGVYEDAATGSAAAALGGLLRDVGWPHGGRVEIRQGIEMGQPSRLVVEIGEARGESVRVSGTTRVIE
uniref:Phenazine biosynthesis protein n=1 Tax=Calcidiscus leptoporus TaxID=127549 RepID=A0A7S0IQY1_9EUKA|mmetsp:Transcript_1818/g.4095  ORF Transcript_1818/g.4095 Transcript_1818/m.4095 type:complete len:321 (+) Transcript_1818:85-1047(+)